MALDMKRIRFEADVTGALHATESDQYAHGGAATLAEEKGDLTRPCRTGPSRVGQLREAIMSRNTSVAAVRALNWSFSGYHFEFGYNLELRSGIGLHLAAFHFAEDQEVARDLAELTDRRDNAPLSEEDEARHEGYSWLLMNDLVGRLRRGELVAKGFAVGSTSLITLPPEWWTQISVERREDSAEANGVRLTGIVVFSANERMDTEDVGPPAMGGGQENHNCRAAKKRGRPSGTKDAAYGLACEKLDRVIEDVGVPADGQKYRKVEYRAAFYLIWKYTEGYPSDSTLDRLIDERIPIVRERMGTRPR